MNKKETFLIFIFLAFNIGGLYLIFHVLYSDQKNVLRREYCWGYLNALEDVRNGINKHDEITLEAAKISKLR